MTNGVDFSPTTHQSTPQLCTMVRLRHHQLHPTILPNHPQLLSWHPKSLRAVINYFSSPTTSAHLLAANGAWFVSLSRTQSRYIHRPFRMGDSSWIFMSCTLPMCVTMPRTSATGFSIAREMESHPAISMHISSLPPILPRTVHCAYTYVPSDAGSISRTVIRMFMDHLSSLLFAAAKRGTASINSHGTYWLQNHLCFQIRSLGAIYPHIPFMWTVAFIQ